jgi:hypothetical protein
MKKSTYIFKKILFFYSIFITINAYSYTVKSEQVTDNVTDASQDIKLVIQSDKKIIKEIRKELLKALYNYRDKHDKKASISVRFYNPEQPNSYMEVTFDPKSCELYTYENCGIGIGARNWKYEEKNMNDLSDGFINPLTYAKNEEEENNLNEYIQKIIDEKFPEEFAKLYGQSQLEVMRTKTKEKEQNSFFELVNNRDDSDIQYMIAEFCSGYSYEKLCSYSDIFDNYNKKTPLPQKSNRDGLKVKYLSYSDLTRYRAFSTNEEFSLVVNDELRNLLRDKNPIQNSCFMVNSLHPYASKNERIIYLEGAINMGTSITACKVKKIEPIEYTIKAIEDFHMLVRNEHIEPNKIYKEVSKNKQGEFEHILYWTKPKQSHNGYYFSYCRLFPYLSDVINICATSRIQNPDDSKGISNIKKIINSTEVGAGE